MCRVFDFWTPQYLWKLLKQWFLPRVLANFQVGCAIILLVNIIFLWLCDLGYINRKISSILKIEQVITFYANKHLFVYQNNVC